MTNTLARPAPSAKPQQGDALVIIRPDGSAQFMTVGFDIEGLTEAVTTGNGTPEQNQQAESLRKVMALAVAANSPDIMRMLYEIAEHPDVVGLALTGAIRKI